MGNAHAAVSAFLGPDFGISEEEVSELSIALAKMVAWRGRLPKVEARIAKHGPWGNLIFVLAAVYGPRLMMLWKLLGEEHKNRMRPVAVIPARERVADPEPAIDPHEKVN